MNEQMFIWWAIVGLIAVAFLFNAIAKFRKETGVVGAHILEVVSEGEMMGMSDASIDDDECADL